MVAFEGRNGQHTARDASPARGRNGQHTARDASPAKSRPDTAGMSHSERLKVMREARFAAASN